MTELRFDGTFTDWRRVARRALADGVTPADAVWLTPDSAQNELALAPATTTSDAAASVSPPPRVPAEFLALAATAACHRDASRWALLYRVLWRLAHGEPHLLSLATDADTHALRAFVKAVDRDVHHMRAFVRFREIATDTGPWFVAWFEPAHHIVELNAPFFRDRFASLRWSILTPDCCMHWDRHALSFTPGVTRDAAPAADAAEELWRTYYASTFNPARLKVATLHTHLPRHFWKNLPEAELIPALVAGARPRSAHMVAQSAATAAPPERFAPAPVTPVTDLSGLRAAAASCRACLLWRHATCTVFGEGPADARVVLVGEQPGDQEDRRGQPFVGPAGQLLERALATAGLDRRSLYLTNAVKHFKWTPRGRRRLHQRPNAREIAACRPWLAAELHALRPELIVCLGATAAQSVLSRAVRVQTERGQRFDTEFGAPALITVHPSSLLRLPDATAAATEFTRFVADLHQARR